ncbi:hypothetical protein ABG79_02166 [Caloramator mitchellensis]|uniref:Uncharacterized protein n=1 Tax=Caloramator mitchellensis TaxID=908809 RepID=A0A0R3JZP4_CALMK|nr:hypothetical protein [Caloramator mitchellensis]KRQ86034.1 hypothetical protein ABG79_02166 [Caloramator mitchellensis]
MKECEVKENCKNFEQGKCWICEDYSLYYPEDKRILCKRQIRQREERKIAKKMKKESEASKRGKRAKRKGYTGEREVVELLNKYKLQAERIPLSGALKSEKYSCDVVCNINGNTKRIEVKRRKSGLNTIYKWLEQDKNSNMLFMRQDNKSWLVCMTLEEFISLIRGDNDV